MKLCGNLGNSNYKLYIAEADAPLHLNWTADGWIYLENEKAKDPDLLTWDQAMRDYPNLKEWMATIAKEIRQLEEKQCWVECLKSEAEEKGEKIILCTWALRIKRNPT